MICPALNVSAGSKGSLGAAQSQIMQVAQIRILPPVLIAPPFKAHSRARQPAQTAPNARRTSGSRDGGD
jgi:hypothetical protein